MQIMLMKRDGNEVGFSALALLTEAASYQLSCLVLSSLAISYYAFSEITLPDITKLLFGLGILINGIVLLFCITAVFKVDYLKRLLYGILVILEKNKLIRLNGYVNKLYLKVDNYKEIGEMIKNDKKGICLMQATSLIKVLAYNSIPLMVALSLGIEVNPIIFILIQSIVNISVSMVPSPGAVGANESVSMILYSQVISGPMVATVMILSRLVSYYIPVLVTGVVILLNIVLSHKEKIVLINLY